MRVRWLFVLPCAAAALVAAALFLRAAPESAESPVEPPAVVEPALESHSGESEALELDGDVISVRESSLREPLGSRVEPQIEAQSPPVQLHGTLIDENTHLPLPEFELEFAVAGEGEGPHRSVTARTDAQGRFQCATPILVARCVVRYVDRPGHRRPPPEATIELEDVRKGELGLAVAWGPTYRLAFAPKERIEPAQVELRQRLPGGGRDRNSGPNEWEPVHAGEPPWVRFLPLAKDAPKVEKLAAHTHDGLWTGEADAGSASGLKPGLTLVTFEERAVLDGTVRDAEKRPVSDVDVVLDAKDSGEQPLKRSARTGVDGHFRFEYLPACAGQVRAVSVRHAPWVQAVTLLAGQVQQLPIELSGLALAGAIGVRVESESGRYAPPFTLVLTLENDPLADSGERFARSVRAQWRDEGERKVALFSFPDLPKQSFRVAVQKDDFFAWDPQQLSLQPPAEGARILIHDGLPNASLCFRAKDAQTGEALQGFEVTLEFPGTRQQARRLGAQSDQPFLEHLPLDRKLAWRIEAGGHVPALGDLSDFQVVEARAEGELRVCELTLRPGWGESYRFLDSRNRSPQKGMRVLLDGIEAGTSDGGGRVLVQAATRPGRIEYKCDELGIALRPLRADRRSGCSTEVRVDPGKPAKGKR